MTERYGRLRCRWLLVGWLAVVGLACTSEVELGSLSPTVDAGALDDGDAEHEDGDGEREGGDDQPLPDAGDGEHDDEPLPDAGDGEEPPPDDGDPPPDAGDGEDPPGDGEDPPDAGLTRS